LYRVFPWDGQSTDDRRGGPLFVPRAYQASTRHGLPEKDGVLYASKQTVSSIAERLKQFRATTLSEDDLWFNDFRWALAAIEVEESIALLDLTDPNVLVDKKINLASIATNDRSLSQQLALRLYGDGVPGFLWGSSLEAVWTNASLFESRIKNYLRVEEPVLYLSFNMPEVIEAAKHIGVILPRPH
jgi:hypothetical protein